MWLLLILAAASAEWVEISQQHYRKPLKHHIVTPDWESEETTTNWNYNNRSVTDNNWNTRIANTVNIQRAQTGNIGEFKKHESQERVNPSSLKDKSVIDEDRNNFDYTSNYKPNKEIINKNDDGKPKAAIERVPSIGNVKRVQLNSSPVKSPAINFNEEKRKVYTTTKIYQNNFDGYEVTETYKPELNNRKQTSERRIYVNEIKEQHSTVRPNNFPIDFEYVDVFTEEVPVILKNSHQSEYINMTKNIVAPKRTFITETHTVSNVYKGNKIFDDINSKIGVSDRIKVSTTEIVKKDNEFVTQNILEQSKNVHNDKNNVSNIRFNPNKDVENKKYQEGNHSSMKNRESDVNKSDLKSATENEDVKENFNKGETEYVKKPDRKVNNLENLMKLMKVVADTITKNSRKSFGGKLQYLHELRDSILANIEDRIESTWPDDEPKGRHTRSAQARGHVNFPSSESALMTISFLTFAVFLIKLVLQVIQTYKQKSMVMAPLVVTSGRALFKQRGQS